MNYLRRLFTSATTVWESLWKLISSKCNWTWNSINQKLYDKAKNTIMKNPTMLFYNEKQQLYLEIDASGVILVASVLQMRDRRWFPRNEAPDNTVLQPKTFASKSLTSAETSYNNIEREALGILHGLENFHHYCFIHDVSMITNHEALVGIFKENVTCLSHRFQRIHQYNIRILY